MVMCLYVIVEIIETQWHPCIDLILIFIWSPEFSLTNVESESWHILGKDMNYKSNFHFYIPPHIYLFLLLSLPQSVPASSWENDYELPQRRLDISYIKLWNILGLHKCGSNLLVTSFYLSSCWCKSLEEEWCYGYLNIALKHENVLCN